MKFFGGKRRCIQWKIEELFISLLPGKIEKASFSLFLLFCLIILHQSIYLSSGGNDRPLHYSKKKSYIIFSDCKGNLFITFDMLCEDL